jgi:hypothetical protein
MRLESMLNKQRPSVDQHLKKLLVKARNFVVKNAKKMVKTTKSL